jgi:hypothetical protein
MQHELPYEKPAIESRVPVAGALAWDPPFDGGGRRGS